MRPAALHGLGTGDLVPHGIAFADHACDVLDIEPMLRSELARVTERIPASEQRLARD